MLDFTYLQPPAFVRSAEVRPVEATPAAEPKRNKRQSPWHEKTGRARSFAKTRAKDRLRPVLMGIDPHCHRCGKMLQDCDSTVADTFARVLLESQRLACEACINVISAERKAARDAAVMEERIAKFLGE